jgi:hypothetical protein
MDDYFGRLNYFNYLKYFFKYIFFQKIDMEQNWNKNLLLFLLCTIVHASTIFLEIFIGFILKIL